MDAIGVAYALVGGLALFRHGYRRFTDDVDLLVTADGLQTIHEQLEETGYIPPFAGSRQLIDTTSNVRIGFLIAGQYFGDGKTKPVVFPDPTEETVKPGGIKVLNLPQLMMGCGYRCFARSEENNHQRRRAGSPPHQNGRPHHQDGRLHHQSSRHSRNVGVTVLQAPRVTS